MSAPNPATGPTVAQALHGRLSELTHAPVRVFRAPGRVNLIGEHTDYNEGFVFPAAIQFYIWVAISPREDRKLVLRSENFEDVIEFDLDQAGGKATGRWSDYMEGVAVTLEAAGHRLRGATLLAHGEVPIGSGLSSSAAISVATGLALLENSGINIPRLELAQICRRSENQFIGARVGIMDPFISCCGEAGKALMLDCRSLAYRTVALPEDVSIVICNTMVKHSLATGEYNTRRRECEQAVQLLRGALPGIHALRDVNMVQLEACRHLLSPLSYRRCRHVITENERVSQAADALSRGDVESFGKCMAESHASLRDDYEVSCSELDTMVTIASEQSNVLGSRMTGGGFGGCTVTLVRSSDVSEFQQNVAALYEKATGLKPQVYLAKAAAGASEVGQQASGEIR